MLTMVAAATLNTQKTLLSTAAETFECVAHLSILPGKSAFLNALNLFA